MVEEVFFSLFKRFYSKVAHIIAMPHLTNEIIDNVVEAIAIAFHNQPKKIAASHNSITINDEDLVLQLPDRTGEVGNAVASLGPINTLRILSREGGVMRVAISKLKQ